MTEQIKPCPFCGEKPTTVSRPDNIDGTEFYAAVACYCGGYSACAHKGAKRKTQEEATSEAIAAWNRRAALSEPAPDRDAYEGCREDLLDWKRRALEAEANNKKLVRALSEAVNGPTFMGEPAAPTVGGLSLSPIAWADDAAFSGGIGNVACSAAKRSWSSSNYFFDREMAKRLRHPLYSAPAAPRAPLTPQQIDGLIHATHFDKRYVLHASDKVCLEWYRLGIKDAEAAHGIGEKT